jgi:hypothetical protein
MRNELIELIEWLRTQFDEDERAAIEAARAIADHTYAPVEVDQHAEAARHWHARRWLYQSKISAAGEKDWQGGSPEVTDSVWTEVGEHIARHDPARVLREVESLRKIIDNCSDWIENPVQGWEIDRADELTLKLDVGPTLLRLLAAIFSGRPGFREEWRLQ